MRLDMVGIVVEDMEKAIKFYDLLGLRVIEGDKKSPYVELENEGVRISLNTKDMITGVFGFAPTSTSEKIELAFLCESKEEINKLVEKLKNHGYDIVKEPWSAPWGQYYALVRDEDKNVISLFINEN